MAQEAAGVELGRVGDARPVLQVSALPAESVRLTGSASRVHMGAQITPL
jgi:hypothetical protein